MASGHNKHIPLKIHLCCGDVYLKDYFNVDGIGKFHTDDNPNITTLDNYYKGNVHEAREVIVDGVCKLPDGINFGEVDAYLMISAFEHFSLSDAKQIICKVYDTLKVGGKFGFDFPDVEETVRKYKNDPEYMMRLVYGSGKNEYGFHRHGYTVKTIKELLKVRPWKHIRVGSIVEHTYPMIGITCIK